MPLTDAVFVIFMVLGVCTVLGAVIFSRHRERMTMIERGMKAEDLKPFFEKSVRPWSPLSSLKWGIVLVAVGAAILLGLWLQETFQVRGGVFPALIALFGGAALVVFYIIANRRERG
jgi:predicted MFS family arabinose efflux permease